ncbi:MAG: ABC transporter permease subunit [Nocardioides sp.]|nr:ABC transporter permease subunit [Nocardioides sp.]
MIVPSVLPQLFVALRVGVNVSVIMIVAAEFLAGNSGLGYLIFDSRRIFMNEQMFVGIVAVSLLGVTLAALVTWTGRLLTPWTRTGRS